MYLSQKGDWVESWASQATPDGKSLLLYLYDEKRGGVVLMFCIDDMYVENQNINLKILKKTFK